MRVFRIIGLMCLLSLVACSKQKEADAAAPPDNASAPAAADSVGAADTGPAPSFDSARAMQYVREIVAFGPRPVGSANHTNGEDYITSHLKGDAVEDDVFTAETPVGKFPVGNITAKFPGPRDGIIVIASPYD